MENSSSLSILDVPKRKRIKRAYKNKYLQARNAVIMLLVLFVLMALVMCWTLNGNLTLQQRINGKIMLTEKVNN